MKAGNTPLVRTLTRAGIVLAIAMTLASPALAVDTLQVISPDPVLAVALDDLLPEQRPGRQSA